MPTKKRIEDSRARIVFETTERGGRLLDLGLKLHGSIRQLARAAGVDEATVKRVCSSDDPIDMRHSKILGFEKAGIPRELLPLPVAG